MDVTDSVRPSAFSMLAATLIAPEDAFVAIREQPTWGWASWEVIFLIVIAVVIVVPPLVSLIPGTIANHVHGYLPIIAGQLVAQTTQQPGDVLSPWQGFGVFCAWTAVLLVACGWLLVRRDA